MSKRIHLVCNAHIDPVWQWEWEEGAAEALSTFQIAADFCEEYEHFVFCHNEALLYQWIEEYAPELFARIQSLVQQKKWHIMGGWHLQPDCNMPCGEAFVRQIQWGRKYFREKFGVEPAVAVNVDSFGHNRGLVQIMAKCGYDGYLFLRPAESFLRLPGEDFTWVGYDGSEVTAVRIEGGYNTFKGHATQKVLECIDKCEVDDFFLCLWGIGNHGGGPSKKDLDDLTVLADEKRLENVELIHSTPEQYIEEVKERRFLSKVAESLNPCNTGCYTSQIRIKQRYRLSENIYFLTEMMCAHAHSQHLLEYPEKELAEAMYDILMVQFHDILPGTSIRPAEEMALRMLDHALEILSRVKTRAFFALTSGQKKATSDRIPVFAYNPYPYPISGDFQCEFMLWDQNRDMEFLMPDLYDAEGNLCPSQCEKEDSTIPIEWRKRVIFHATLKPMSMNRFDCGFHAIPAKPVPELEKDDLHYFFRREDLLIAVNRHTGLVDKIHKGGRDYVQEKAFALEVFADNYDPWYMENTVWKEKIGEFRLLTSEETAEFCHVDAPIDAVRVVEGGAVRTVVEAVFGYRDSRAVVKYIFSDYQDDMKVDVHIVWNEKQKLVKMNIPAAYGVAECIGEQVYGRETLKGDMEENVSQKYILMCAEGDEAILAMNNGVYGSSFDDTCNSLKITLLRSPSYCAHPLEGRITMPQDRYIPYIEQGERDFSFQIAFGEKQKLLDKASRKAQEFNMQPILMSFYPRGKGELPQCPISLLDTDIINITAFKKADEGDGYLIRLFNPTDKDQSARVRFGNIEKTVSFGKYEIKTLRCSHDDVAEEEMRI